MLGEGLNRSLPLRLFTCDSGNSSTNPLRAKRASVALCMRGHEQPRTIASGIRTTGRLQRGGQMESTVDANSGPGLFCNARHSAHTHQSRVCTTAQVRRSHCCDVASTRPEWHHVTNTNRWAKEQACRSGHQPLAQNQPRSVCRQWTTSHKHSSITLWYQFSDFASTNCTFEGCDLHVLQ